MNDNKAFLTQEGFEKSQQELLVLRTEKRKDVAERLHKAVEEAGTDNLAEDAEYEAAKNEQAFIEGRIRHLEILLSKAQIIEEETHEVVQVGATVTIQEDGLEPEVYKIVGAEEANPRNGLISNVSPLGLAIMNHDVGDTVEVEAPSGNFSVTIVKVE